MKDTKTPKKKLAFETRKDRDFSLKAWYLKDESSDALIELFYQDKLVREMKYPAYKIYNLAAHFSDIVDSEINNDTRGYEVAGSTGFGGVIMPKPI